MEVVRGRKAKLGFGGDSEAHGGLGEVEGPLACVGGLCESVLELQASAGYDGARTGDLRPICGDGALCIRAALLRVRVERECSQRDGKEYGGGRLRHPE